MKTSDLFVACLAEEGITHVFGVPGEENADLLMSLEAAGVTFVLTRHEQGAGFMASTYGRLTGSPAICLATLGPGATNLLTPVTEANMDHAPLIAVTGQAAVTRLHKESHQVINIEDLYLPVTKWAASIRDPDSVPELVRKAVRQARAEKPGAVVLELPEDIAGMKAEGSPLTPHRFRRPSPDEDVVETVWDRIKTAKQPIMIAGNGAIRTRASAALRALCELTGIGVVSTFMGKGAVDRDAPYCLFTIGLSQRDLVVEVLDAADLIITIGYDMVEYPPELWNPRCKSDVIHVDFLPAEIDRNYQPCLEMIGDVANGLAMLTERARRDGAPDYDFAVQSDVRARMLKEFAEFSGDDNDGPVRPQKLVWDLRAALGPSDILLSGVGAHKMWIARHYQCNQPNTCLIPNGFCSMGGAFPGAIGARIACPGVKIVAAVGDGDFLMNVQEMETARRLNSDITVVVWVDNAYGLIAWKQDSEFGRHTELSFGNPDWEALAATFGWQGQWVKGAGEFAPALETALAHEGPSLIAVPVDYRENALLAEQLGSIEMKI